MKSSATSKAAKASGRKVADMAPKKDQDVNGGLNFVAVVSKPSPKLS